MVHAMKEVVRTAAGLNAEERNMLSVSYKSLLVSKRSAWRAVYGIEKEEDGKRGVENEFKLKRLRPFRKKIEKEIEDTCHEILAILEKNLIPQCQCPESAVFYFKMKGDYYRYLAEFKVGSGRRECSEKALVAYRAATQCADAKLAPEHPVVLGLALNFSVFYFEILHSPERACQIAQAAFDKAKSSLRNSSENKSNDSTLLLQLLRDNLSLWTADLVEINQSTPLTAIR